tara:strand:- start:170 stop:406 length:237 start_codon:yes stop_codon:yes gene_type:complete
MSKLNDSLEDIFREVFDDENISLSNEMSADDIENWDSLNHVKLLLACEETFDIKFDVQEIEDLKKVKDLISLIEEKMT